MANPKQNFNITFNATGVRTRVTDSFRTTTNRDEVSTDTTWGVREYFAINHGNITRPTGEAWVHFGFNGADLKTAIENAIKAEFPTMSKFHITQLGVNVGFRWGRHSGISTSTRNYNVLGRTFLSSSSSVVSQLHITDTGQGVYSNNPTPNNFEMQYQVNWTEITTIPDDLLQFGIQCQILSLITVGNEIRMFPNNSLTLDIIGEVELRREAVVDVYQNGTVVDITDVYHNGDAVDVYQDGDFLI